MVKTLIIQISCQDRAGIVAKTTALLFKNGGNIITLEQHVEVPDLFFMRIKVELPDQYFSEVTAQLRHLTDKIQAKVSWRDASQLPKVAILVSKESHCLTDLLARYEAGELACQITLVISNHAALSELVGRYKIPFHHLEVFDMTQHEHQINELLSAKAIDLVVLARYMRILSANFIGQFDERIINIHHSFLPAFIGAKPYHRAWQRGVKVIGATAHYATSDLDEGPIIAQEVQPVSHHNSIPSLVEAGRETEQRALSSAVKAWLEYRIVTHDRRTIIFQSE